MKRKWLVVLFAILALIQLAVPASLIVNREVVLRTGRRFKFKVMPIDPYDAFRGRYVDLGFEQDEAPNPPRTSYRQGQMVYALLAEDADGFAFFTGLSTARPAGDSYLRTKIAFIRWQPDRTVGDTVHLQLPFDRYYTEEKAAPAVERAMPPGRAEGVKEAYVTVRIMAGQAVLEELFMEGESVRKLIREGQL